MRVGLVAVISVSVYFFFLSYTKVGMVDGEALVVTADLAVELNNTLFQPVKQTHTHAQQTDTNKQTKTHTRPVQTRLLWLLRLLRLWWCGR